jgi:hypothetical protein
VGFRLHDSLWFDGGVAVSLTPVVLVEALGLRRFGSLSGLVGLVATSGTAGPLLVGVLYDATSSYTISYEVCAAAFLVSALAAVFIVPMEDLRPADRPDYRRRGADPDPGRDRPDDFGTPGR